MQELPWMAHAWSDLGQREAPGSDDNPRIAGYFRELGHRSVSEDTPWCAAFVGAQLERAGITSTRSLRARSYLDWGMAIEAPKPGAVAVLARGADPALGHVGFLVAMTPSRVILLGGNQSNAVTVEAFDRTRLIGLRLPAPAAPQSRANSETDQGFERAMALVLRHEGGWSDDPFDPGGATNKGITLATYAREIGVEIDADNIENLKSELRRIPDALVRRIYLERYWKPGTCAALPPPIALFHFDTAVNQGLGTAARLLQQALGVAIDGEIGPITLAAAHDKPLTVTLDRYAELRRARYRALPHFWRFGRGWLRRVDGTLAAAHRLTRDVTAAPGSSPNRKEPPPMAFEPASLPDAAPSNPPARPTPGPKWWGESMTIWGTILTAVSTVAPAVLAVLGIDLPADLIQKLGHDAVLAAQALGGLIGTVLTVAGRLRADQRLATRRQTLRV
jgi:uncharacterized protein (TIGR02594 family)